MITDRSSISQMDIAGMRRFRPGLSKRLRNVCTATMKTVRFRLLTLPALLAISAFSQTTVAIPFACTAEEIDHFGLNCSAEQPCPVYADLNSVESIGARVFVTGNLHTDSVTLASLLFGSGDS